MSTLISPMDHSVQPFRFPAGLPPQEYLSYSLQVISKYRQELPYLRRSTTILKKQHEKLDDEVTYWKEKYKESTKENERLKKEIEKITKTKRRYQVALFDHGNFHHPDKKDKKPNGGQIGHENTNPDKQRNYASYTRQKIYAKHCGQCGKQLSRVKATKQKILMDIQINTHSLQVIVASERQWCGNCRREVRAHHLQSLPFTEYGMNTFMVVMYLRFKGKQSKQTIATTLTSLFGLTISPSGVGTLLMQAKGYLREKYEELKQAIRDGAIMYNDETGWRIRGVSAWIWIMANEKETVYVAAQSRGKGIMEEMYGNSQSYSMHDGYAGYTNTVPVDKQLYCWAHALRFVYEETILEKKGSVAHCLKGRLVTLYQTIRSHPQWTRKQKEQLLEKEFNEILVISQDSQTIKNILHRLKTQKDGLIRALLVTKDGTNNLAERELRPLAISRNISYGSGSYNGMEVTAILASIIQTISRDTSSPFLPTLQSYLHTGIQKKYPQYKHPPSFAT